MSQAEVGRARAAMVVGVVVAALVTACTGSHATSQAEGAGGAALGGMAQPTQTSRPGPVPLAAADARVSGGVVAAPGEAAPYNYAPSVMADGGRYRMWWCSQLQSAPPPGDDVLYAESSSLDGPFTAPGGAFGVAVFSGSGGTAFDARHTCDPSVIRVGGTYYLYYTGAPSDHGSGNAIGLAVSSDGITWARANGGNPVISPSNEVARANHYGAGQPSALYLDGWFYLLFTDTTGSGAGENGAGQFVLRSRDPAFTSGVEAVGPTGFVPVNGTATGRARSVVDAFSADWMWVDALNAFAIAHETGDGTTITFWNRDFSANPYQPVLIPGPWAEGPGLARGPDGHAPVSAQAPCDQVPVDVVRATRDPAEPTDLRHFGLDLVGVGGCADGASAAATLQGFGVPSPQRTVDVVIGQAVVRVERRSVAEAAGFRVLDRRPRGVDALPVAAHLTSGVPVLAAPGVGAGFVLDDRRLWPIRSAQVAVANSSPITEVPAAQWAAYPRGADFAASG